VKLTTHFYLAQWLTMNRATIPVHPSSWHSKGGMFVITTYWYNYWLLDINHTTRFYFKLIKRMMDNVWKDINCIRDIMLDRLCGLVVRVLGYRSGGPGSIPGTTRKTSSGSGTGCIQPGEYNWGATW
jgi:hypothetical protein